MNFSIYTGGGYPYRGAAETFVRNLSEGLLENNQNVTVYVFRGNYLENRKKGGSHNGVSFSPILFRKRKKNELLKIIEFFTLIFYIPLHVITKKIQNRTSAILLYGIDYPYFTIPFLITAKLTGSKIYRIVTDQFRRESIVPVWWKSPKYMMYNAQTKSVDKFFNGIVCLSTFLKEGYQKRNYKPSKTFLIPHFIKPLTIDNDVKPVSKNRFGYSGAIIEANGITDLLDAARIVFNEDQKSELLLVGDMDHATELIKQKVKDLEKDYPGRVLATGLLRAEQVPKALLSCKVLVNPRRASTFAEAGFPTKLGEYFATKRIVVATKVGDLAKYFKDEQELLFAEPDDPESIAKCIQNAFMNETKRAEVGKKGYAWMINNIHYVKSASTLIKYINNV